VDLQIAQILAGPDFRIDAAPAAPDAGTGADSGGEGGFGSALTKAVGRLEASQAEASTQSQQLATGEAQDITSVVLATERASLELQLATQLRNKAVDAYQELFRMQI
jgi:flagellar hook-basal body complex protein FliE